MKWFDLYFDFFSQKNAKYLLDIIEEFISSTHSFDALPYTKSVISKMQPELIQSFEDETSCISRSKQAPH